MTTCIRSREEQSLLPHRNNGKPHMGSKLFWMVVISLLVVGALLFFMVQRTSSSAPYGIAELRDDGVIPLKKPMKLKSLTFQHNTLISSRYTCDGDNVSPPLKISGVPPAAKSLALIVDDPDAPRGTWVHWILWNISPATTEIAEYSVPDGAEEGVTSFGRPGYGGPCPPSGTHRYFFKLYALDVMLNLPAAATKEDVERAMREHILEKTELIGLYHRT